MSTRSGTALTWFLLVPFSSVAAEAQAQTPQALFSELPATSTRRGLDGSAAGPETRRSRKVGIRLPLLDQARATVATGDTMPFMLNLFDADVLEVSLNDVSRTERGYALFGRVATDPLSSVVLIVNGNTVVGSVWAPASSATYSIQTVRDGIVAIRQIELPTRLGAEDVLTPPSHGGSPLATGSRGGPIGTPLALAAADPTTDGSRIDVMVFYTPAVKEAAGGLDAVEALVDLYIAGTNRAYADSGVIHRLYLTRAVEVDYTEHGTTFDMIGHFRGMSDGHMDEVHALRDR